MLRRPVKWKTLDYPKNETCTHSMYKTLCTQMFKCRTLIVQTKFWAATWQNQQNECAPSEDSDQPGHPPSLIRVFAVRMKAPWVLSYPLSAQRKLWSDWADAQADLSLRLAHTHFVGFVMSWLKLCVILMNWWRCSRQYLKQQMWRLIWVFAWRTFILLVLSCRGSNDVLY